jgi:peptide/nickel transport system substrate-binding protein
MTCGVRSVQTSVLAIFLAAAVLPAVGAGSSTASAVKDGGVLRVNLSTTGVRSLDPAVDYEFYGAQILFATCARLLSYPDKTGVAGSVLGPEVAAAMPRVSNGGRTYTFTIRKGFRFNTGEPVTAASFAHEIRRVLSKTMASPGARFVSDIVGAGAELSGKANRPSGVKADGNRLTITLVAPSPTFPQRIALPFFCAVPADLPITRGGVDTPPMAGPYYIKSYALNRTITLLKNPYYGGARPRHVDEIDVTLNTNLDQSLLQVSSGQADYDMVGVPPTADARLAHQHGINKGRFWVYPFLAVNYVALNTRRPAFKDVSVRRAVNYAVDRLAITNLAGFEAGTPTDQVLPPGLPGYHDASIYPDHPDLARARRLMAGRELTVNFYTSAGSPTADQAIAIQAELKQIGITVRVTTFPFNALIQAIGPKQPYDMVLIGWGADYPDPWDFLNVLFDGHQITNTNNQNLALLDDPAFNSRFARAALLTGDTRYAAYGTLDVDLMRRDAPWIPINNPTNRLFVSSRTGCFTYPPPLAGMDLAVACLK